MNQAYKQETNTGVENWLKQKFPNAFPIQTSLKHDGAHFAVVDEDSSSISVAIVVFESKTAIRDLLAKISQRPPQMYKRWICIVGTPDEARTACKIVKDIEFDPKSRIVIGTLQRPQKDWLFMEYTSNEAPQAAEA